MQTYANYLSMCDQKLHIYRHIIITCCYNIDTNSMFLEELGNTTPSLSLIVSLIIGASLITSASTCTTSDVADNTRCINKRFVGITVIVVGIILFYLAQNNNLASYEGLWIIVSSIVGGLML